MRRCVLIFLVPIIFAAPASAWFDETHIAIAKAAGYQKWYNAAAADIARVKLGDLEKGNHSTTVRLGLSSLRSWSWSKRSFTISSTPMVTFTVPS